jgi:hypothetical protein
VVTEAQLKHIRLTIREAERIPWWGRIWRIRWQNNIADILPIPICYPVRSLWNAWCFSFRIRRNQYEKHLAQAYKQGSREATHQYAQHIQSRFDVICDLLDRGAIIDPKLVLAILPDDIRPKETNHAPQ